MEGTPADGTPLTLVRGTLTKDLNRRLSSMRDVGVALEDTRQGVASGP